MSAVYRICRQASFWLLLAVLLAAPLPLGSYRDWAWSPLGAAVALIGLLQAAGTLERERVAWVPSGSLLPSAIAFGVVVLWALLQTIALPGVSNPVVDQAYASLGLAGSGRIALRPDAVFTGVMKWLTYAVAFWIVVHAARDPRKAKQLLVVVVLTGVLITLYGLLTEIAAGLKGDLPAMFPKLGDGFSTTFFNKNSYATYAGLCVLVTITLLRMDMPSMRRDDLPLRVKVHRVMQSAGGALGLYGAAMVILVGGLLLSGSRAGLISFACGLGALWLLGRRRSLLGVAIGILLAIVLFVLVGGAGLLLKFLTIGNDTSSIERSVLYNLSIEAISLRPWTGWGVGSFESIYSIFQPATQIEAIFDKAHNTYLELMLDLGIPFGLVLPLVVLSLVARCVVGLRERARHQEMPALAIAATLLVGVHSMFDFSLQIPAVALTYVALLGIGWTQSWSSRQPERFSGKGGPSKARRGVAEEMKERPAVRT